MYKTVWTEEKLNDLKKMLNSGMGTREISEILKISKPTISRKRKELGYKLERKTNWSKEEENFLIQCLNNGIDNKTISLELGRSETSIINKMKLLGNSEDLKIKNYYDTTYKYIIYQCKKQLNIKIASVVLNLSEKTVINKLLEAEKLGYINKLELKKFLS